MRGGLDDALDKLARRDELRRRAAGEATGTPPAVTELVEAIAAVVGRHPELGVTVGVEGAGEPLLLHFYYGDGQVQVNAENAMVGRPGEPISPAPVRHADVVVEAEEAEPATVVDDRVPAAADRWPGGFDVPPDVGESSRDLGARMRNLGMATTRGETAYPPHPFAKTPPPPVPPQTAAPASHPPMSAPPVSPPMAGHPPAGWSTPVTPMPAPPRPAVPPQSGPTHAEFGPPDRNATRRIRPDQFRSPGDSSVTERIPHQATGLPRPLPTPIPLQVERPEETELAARRVAALLRDDPGLLSQPPE